MTEQSRVLVAVPVTHDNLWALEWDGRMPHAQVLGFAPNAELTATFGVEPGEEAEAAALQMADVAGLTAGRVERLVVVAEVPASRLSASPGEAANGAVVVDHLVKGDCQAFFTGDCDAQTAQAARGLSLDDAWELPGIQKMLASQPLAWHDVSELAEWLGDPVAGSAVN